MSDFFESGFVVGQKSWHGKETLLQQPPVDYMEALNRAGLNWEVLVMPLFFMGGQCPHPEVPAGINALVRSTDSRVLGTCEKRYRVFQNEAGFKWCQPLVETGWWTFETGGSVREGEYCWALLRQDETEIVPNDKLLCYLLVSWNHTGSQANVVKLTTTRVVCWNTLSAALAGPGARTNINHFSSMGLKYQEIQQYYLKTTAAFARQEQWFKELADTKMTDVQLENYVDILFPPSWKTPDGGLDLSEAQAGRMNAVNNRVKELVVNGSSAQTLELGIKNTAWGAFNGVTQYLEFEAGGKRIKDRAWRVMFGPGQEEQYKAGAALAQVVGISLPPMNSKV